MKCSISLNLCSTDFQKALTWLLIFFEESELVICQPSVESFLLDVLEAGEALVGAASCDLDNLKSLNLTDLPEIEAEELNGSFRRRNGGLLLKAYILIHSLDQNIDSLRLQNDLYKIDFEKLNRIFEGCLILNSSVSGILMNYEYEQDRFLDWDDHYMPNLFLQQYICALSQEEQFRAVYISPGIGESDHDYLWVENRKKQCDMQLVRSGLNFIKLQTILITMIESPFFNKNTKKLAKEILLVFKELLADTRILKIIIEPNLHFSDQEKGPRSSTKMEIFFALDNTDRFCLRIDFPHADVTYVHYNLHEPGQATGLPVQIKEKSSLIQLCETKKRYETLFFEHNGMIWFRWDFLKKLNQETFTDPALRQKLEEWFHEQGHYRIAGDEHSEDEIKDFLGSLTEGAADMNLDRCIYEKTKLVNIEKELTFIQAVDMVYQFLILYEKVIISQKVFGISEDEDVMKLKEKLVSALKSLLKNDIDPEVFNDDMDFKEVVDFVMAECGGFYF